MLVWAMSHPVCIGTATILQVVILAGLISGWFTSIGDFLIPCIPVNKASTSFKRCYSCE